MYSKMVLFLLKEIIKKIQNQTEILYFKGEKLRGHAQTMWTAMGGGGVHEMSTLLIKPI